MCLGLFLLAAITGCDRKETPWRNAQFTQWRYLPVHLASWSPCCFIAAAEDALPMTGARRRRSDVFSAAAVGSLVNVAPEPNLLDSMCLPASCQRYAHCMEAC